MSTNQPAPGAAEHARGEGTPDARQLRTILIAVSIALMAVIASMSGLNVAQTQMAVEFSASQSTILWIINSYTLALAALLLPLGAIGDRLGRKPMLIAGLGVFGVASVAAGLAPTAEQSFVDGWQQAMWSGVAVMGALFVYVALRGPKSITPAAPSHDAEASETVSAR